jgi:hypothetical protein
MTLDDRPLDDLPAPLIGNKAIETAAIDFVMELEREAGRQPRDRRYDAAFPLRGARPSIRNRGRRWGCARLASEGLARVLDGR